MSTVISTITSSTWYASAMNAASSIGGYLQSAAASSYSGLSATVQWAGSTAMPAVWEGIGNAGVAALQGLEWTAYTAVPAAANGALHALTQLFHAVVAAPFVIVQNAQTLWTSLPIQAALLALTIVSARLVVDRVEKHPHIQNLPHEGRLLARFITAMSITGVAVGFGGLLGLPFTSYKLYAVALTLLAALDSTSRVFLQNAFNQYEAGTNTTVPLYVRIRGNAADALASFNLQRTTFSRNLTPERANLLTEAQRFPVRPGGWVELGEWMTRLNPQGDGQKAYALALWMHLVETSGPLEAQKGENLTVRYNHTTWDHTIQIQPSENAGEPRRLHRSLSEGNLVP